MRDYGGQNAWSQDKVWQLTWADYFEDADSYTKNITWDNTAGLSISQAERKDGVFGNYYYVFAIDRARTYTYYFGNAYTADGVSWNAYDFTDDAYKLEFDVAFRSDRNQANKVTLTIPDIAKVEIVPFATTGTFTNIDGTTELFSVNVAYDYNSTDNILENHFYHFVIEARSTGTNLTVYGPYENGKFPETPIYSGSVSDSKIIVKTMTGSAGRYYGSLGLDNVEIYKEVEASKIETPTAAITKVDGVKRIVGFSCPTDGVTLSYSVDGGNTFVEGNSVEISTTTNIIVKATRGSVSVTSDPMTFEAGSEVTLAVPTISVTALTKTGSGLYYKTLSASSDNTDVLLSPKAVCTATFEGQEVELPYTPTANGTLKVTASADGYASSEADVPVVGYGKVVFADYVKNEVTSLPPVGVRKISSSTMGAHFDYVEGEGLKGVRVGGNGWIQINKAGMVGYDLKHDGNVVEVIDLNNNNTGNNSFKYITTGDFVERLYTFGEARAISLNSANTYSTYCSTANLDFANATGIEAYAVKVNGNEIVLTKVEGNVKENEGLLIKNVDEVSSAVVPLATDAESLSDNDLIAATAEVVADGSQYALTKKNGVTGFAPVQAGVVIPAGKAYLQVGNSNGDAAKFITIGGGDATGINTVNAANNAADAYYTLQGVKTTKPAAKGVYILNGKKVIVNK